MPKAVWSSLAAATTVHMESAQNPALFQSCLAWLAEDHTPASYTILMAQVDDIEAAAGDLATRGVRFGRYDGMDQDERGITRGSDFPFIAAWFKDSAGNILEVVQER